MIIIKMVLQTGMVSLMCIHGNRRKVSQGDLNLVLITCRSCGKKIFSILIYFKTHLIIFATYTRALFQYEDYLSIYRIPIIKIRQSFNSKWYFLYHGAPWWLLCHCDITSIWSQCPVPLRYMPLCLSMNICVILLLFRSALDPWVPGGSQHMGRGLSATRGGDQAAD